MLDFSSNINLHDDFSNCYCKWKLHASNKTESWFHSLNSVLLKLVQLLKQIIRNFLSLYLNILKVFRRLFWEKKLKRPTIRNIIKLNKNTHFLVLNISPCDWGPLKPYHIRKAVERTTRMPKPANICSYSRVHLSPLDLCFASRQQWPGQRRGCIINLRCPCLCPHTCFNVKAFGPM